MAVWYIRKKQQAVAFTMTKKIIFQPRVHELNTTFFMTKGNQPTLLQISCGRSRAMYKAATSH
jgi:hypothetical protein